MFHQNSLSRSTPSKGEGGDPTVQYGHGSMLRAKHAKCLAFQPQQMLEMSPTRPPSGPVIESETCVFCCVTCRARGRTLQHGTRRGSSTCAIARRGPGKSKPSRNHSLQSSWIPTKHLSLPRPGPITRQILPTPPRRWWTTAKTTLELRRGRPERPVAERRQSKTKHRQGEPRGARLCLRSGQKGCPLCDQGPCDMHSRHR